MAAQSVRLVLGSEALSALPPSRSLDTRGKVCPFPSFESAKLAEAAIPGEVIEIVSDDEYTASKSIPTVLRLRNFEYAVLEAEDGTYFVRARKPSVE